MREIISKKNLGKLVVYLAVLGGFLVFSPSLSSDDFDTLSVYFQNVAEENKTNNSGKLAEKKEVPKITVQEGLLGEKYNYEEWIKP
ncbi:MAG: hypothetical protein NC898_04470 [Candidatus Omnitrophica bacterium]|nr:hypothetical protein [Candidatus Omnitrophota bacterium]MCM8793701.1 hypothetical protein [Candidatus Omnitrophota bacterium]